MSRIGPRKFTCMTVSTVAASSSRVCRRFGIPALFTRTSTPPECRRARRRRAGRPRPGRRGRPPARARPHRVPGTPRRSRPSRSRSRPLIASTAPRRANSSASPIPMPDDAPVTSTRASLVVSRHGSAPYGQRYGEGPLRRNRHWFRDDPPSPSSGRRAHAARGTVHSTHPSTCATLSASVSTPSPTRSR